MNESDGSSQFFPPHDFIPDCGYQDCCLVYLSRTHGSKSTDIEPFDFISRFMDPAPLYPQGDGWSPLYKTMCIACYRLLSSILSPVHMLSLLQDETFVQIGHLLVRLVQFFPMHLLLVVKILFTKQSPQVGKGGVVERVETHFGSLF